MKIDKLIETALSSKSNLQVKANLGKVNTNVIQSIKEELGFNVTDYKHIIDNFAIKHILLKHGNAEKESLRGQIAVTLDVFELIPEILKNPDKITDGGISKIGRKIILYEKTFTDKIIYVEEIRTKRKELALLTMYIQKKS